MATRSISSSVPRLLTRSFASSSPLSKTPAASSLLSRSRPLAAALSPAVRGGFVSVKGLSSLATASSLNDRSPNWSNRPPKETILLDGCDFEHWLVVVNQPQGDPTRDEIIDSYIKTLAQIVGSEEEARMKIYSVSHRCYFAFGALVSEDLSHRLKELPNVRWVLPDSYLDGFFLILTTTIFLTRYSPQANSVPVFAYQHGFRVKRRSSTTVSPTNRPLFLAIDNNRNNVL